ncbi:formate/nitrite transporter family protein [Histidinibacterium aquaticum]|uniref:Formate/nitrite transporter family protein n=1 Tax=Histidinibacterium aquaticum TaxID=2613962 RepID=A0A5J5GIK6_9RHOB|nr:formate/nitrite transporter family protein [Histidinibacterium aquaticum]KAA9007957.1 formate/nitrite transporter family protein [Histidinibacterium aquaticum]
MANEAEHPPFSGHKRRQEPRSAEERDHQERADRHKEQTEEQHVESATKLTSKLVYEVIRRDGEEELSRTNRSLFVAGLSAGVLIGFSLVAESVFRTYLPDAEWTFLVENLGYSFGFLLVILGRMQLFTENTITAVLPALRDPCLDMLWQVSRLWGVVLGANVVGAAIAGGWMAYVGSLPPEVQPAIEELSLHATSFGAWETFLRGIPAGLLVAAIVWMMPQAEGGEVLIITMFTWLIAAGDFTHVIVGSVEISYLVAKGLLPIWTGITTSFLPMLAGNVVGGTVIFALMAWGQVRDDFVPGQGR